MGTNYYLHENVCPHCGRSDDRKHIGKSSGGWCFALHVDDELGIRNLSDWEIRFAQANSAIKNEYGDTLSPEQMLQIIKDRSWPMTPKNRWSKKDYDDNHAEPGANGLIRHRIDGRHCTGHGAGTWDHITGEFS